MTKPKMLNGTIVQDFQSIYTLDVSKDAGWNGQVITYEIPSKLLEEYRSAERTFKKMQGKLVKLRDKKIDGYLKANKDQAIVTFTGSGTHEIRMASVPLRGHRPSGNWWRTGNKV